MKTSTHNPHHPETIRLPRAWAAYGARGAIAAAALVLTAAAAIFVKERGERVRPLVAVDYVWTSARGEEAPPSSMAPGADRSYGSNETYRASEFAVDTPENEPAEPDDLADLDPETLALARDPQVRWFDGRPVRPARRMWMTVTGYSPDERSCGEFADGQTATLHSVFTNGMKLVAADTSVLPFGSLLSIPGYDGARVVPVLDRGGAIKGNKLDLLFPTHEEALEWGRKRMLVTVWEYADGKPAGDPRKAR
ncbi:MAG: 3D domain-containing protein [Phycisphaerales bacterium]